MLRGLPASIIAHAAVLSASYLTWPYWGTSSRVFVDEMIIVDADIVDISEINNIAPAIEQEPEEEPVAPEPEEEVPEEDPLPEELPEAEQDVTNIDEAPAVEEDPENVLPDFEAETPEDEIEPEPEPEDPPQPPQRRAQDDLMDFLNQSETTFKSERETRRERPEPRAVATEETTTTALRDAPVPAETRNRQGAGERNANQARIDSILYSRIFPCWDGVSDLPFPDRLNVRMKLRLNMDGSIDELSLIEPSSRPVGNSPMRTAVERALRAVRQCAPYNLPQDDYENWREGSVNLGPAFAPTNQR